MQVEVAGRDEGVEGAICPRSTWPAKCTVSQ